MWATDHVQQDIHPTDNQPTTVSEEERVWRGTTMKDVIITHNTLGIRNSIQSTPQQFYEHCKLGLKQNTRGEGRGEQGVQGIAEKRKSLQDKDSFMEETRGLGCV
jgi:hypothetical protein